MGPAEFWPYSRKDHISEDHITGNDCTGNILIPRASFQEVVSMLPGQLWLWGGSSPTWQNLLFSFSDMVFHLSAHFFWKSANTTTSSGNLRLYSSLQVCNTIGSVIPYLNGYDDICLVPERRRRTRSWPPWVCCRPGRGARPALRAGGLAAFWKVFVKAVWSIFGSSRTEWTFY